MRLDGIKEFIEKSCPLIQGKKIKVNYLAQAPVSYTIDLVPGAPLIKRYTDGGSLRQCVFLFASREYYDQETRQNLNTAEFYEAFEAWLEQCNAGESMPELGEGRTGLRWEVLSSGYLYQEATGNARYQMQCRLIYRQAAEKKGRKNNGIRKYGETQ